MSTINKKAILVSLIIVGAAYAALSWIDYSRFQYLFYLRVPLSSGALLFLLPAIALYLLPTMLGNMFVLSNWQRLAAVIPSGIWAGLGIVTVGRAIYMNIPCRFFEKCTDSQAMLNDPGILWPYLLALILGMPIAVTVYLSSGPASTEMDDRQRYKGTLIGAAISVLLLYSVYFLRNDASLLSSWAEGFIVALLKFIPSTETYYSSDGKLLPGHIDVFWFFVVSGLLYISGLCFFRPRVNLKKFWQKYQAPALFYVIELVLLLTLVFGFLTLWLDYYKLPVLLLFVAYSIVTYRIWNVEHEYELKESAIPVPTIPDTINALHERLKNQTDSGRKKTLVVVCASGGGIQAAGWTAKVLTGLQARLDGEFIKAVGLISAVSGGSVGTLHFLDQINQEKGYPDSDTLGNIFNAATKESLSATGWGLIYPDFWRFIGLPFLKTTPGNRAAAIDTDWKANLKYKDVTLREWVGPIKDGKLPIPVFNATLVEDGRRYLVSPMSFEFDPQYRGGVDFNTLFPKGNMDASTAALLSATFPYVSPIMRNTQLQVNDPVFHVADGGFFDNYGVVTATDWLDKQVLPNNAQLGIERVFLVMINAFHEVAPNNQGSSEPKGWLMAFAGPILAVLNARNSTQMQRNMEEIEELRNIWNAQGIDIQPFNITFPKSVFFMRHFPEISINAVKQFTDKHRLSYKPPLSWMLSKKQKKAIEDGWNTLLNDPNSEVNDLINRW